MVRICYRKSRVPSRVAPGSLSDSPLLWYQAVPGRLPLKGGLYPHSFWASTLEDRDPTEAGSGARRGPVQARLCYTGFVRGRALKSELSKFKKVPEESIEQYLNRLVQIANGLRNIGVTISEKEKVTIVLNPLPAEYNTLTTMLDLVGEVKSFADIRRILVQEEAKLSVNMSYFARNLQATAQNPLAAPAQKQKMKCQYCQKIGHEVDT
eukprot:scaffold561_cov380-Pavlova_lutheri.AAC.2